MDFSGAFNDAVAKAAREHGQEVLDTLNKVGGFVQSAADFVGALTDEVADLVEQHTQAPVDESVVTREVKIEYILNNALPHSVYTDREFLNRLSDDMIGHVFRAVKSTKG